MSERHAPMPSWETEMKIYRLAAIALLFSPLSGCLGPQPILTDDAQVAVMTRATHDEYKKTTSFKGVNASRDNYLVLRGWRDDRTKSTEFQVYITSYYSGQWRFYSEAYDSEGNRLDFVSIDQHVASCGSYSCRYSETIGLNVSRQYLEDHRTTGIRFKVSGKAGEFTDFLPAAYIKGFLDSVDATAG
jgi:hypothetical protein